MPAQVNSLFLQLQSAPPPPRVAVVHDWLVCNGGAERTLAHILRCYPQADVFTLVDFLPDSDRGFLRGHRVFTSRLQRWPFARSHYRKFLPWMPMAIEDFDLSGYQLVISSSSSVAKGVITGPDQLHISYVHSPMRYAWDLQHQYLREHKLTHGVKSLLARRLLHRMRLWDVRSANGVDWFLCNSQFIARRIAKTYRREAYVIHPPVDTEYFQPASSAGRADWYLTASRLVPYKRIGLIIDAFRHMPDRQLLVIGDGPEFARLSACAPGNVRMLGRLPDSEVRRHMQQARAFVFAALEDFGIVPVEAQACATPVIAYGEGGATETVLDGRTGVLFREQSVSSLVNAVRRFERRSALLAASDIRSNAMRFSAERFRQQLLDFVDSKLHPAVDGRQARR